VQERVDDIVALVQSSVAAASPAAKHYRMGLISALARVLAPERLVEFLPEVIPEMIMCTKEVNERARAAAYETIAEVGRVVGNHGGFSE
jgi:ribosomal RNA-processing protein 12